MYAEQTLILAQEIESARQRLPKVVISEQAKELGLDLVQQLDIASNRAEITLFEASRSYAAADERLQVIESDVEAVALIALRMRQSSGLAEFLKVQHTEDEKLRTFIAGKRMNRLQERPKAS